MKTCGLYVRYCSCDMDELHLCVILNYYQCICL